MNYELGAVELRDSVYLGNSLGTVSGSIRTKNESEDCQSLEDAEPICTRGPPVVVPRRKVGKPLPVGRPERPRENITAVQQQIRMTRSLFPRDADTLRYYNHHSTGKSGSSCWDMTLMRNMIRRFKIQFKILAVIVVLIVLAGVGMGVYRIVSKYNEQEETQKIIKAPPAIPNKAKKVEQKKPKTLTTTTTEKPKEDDWYNPYVKNEDNNNDDDRYDNYWNRYHNEHRDPHNRDPYGNDRDPYGKDPDPNPDHGGKNDWEWQQPWLNRRNSRWRNLYDRKHRKQPNLNNQEEKTQDTSQGGADINQDKRNWLMQHG